MKDLYELVSVCIATSNEIYHFALTERIEEISIKYSALSNNINELCIAMLGSEILPIIIQKMEEIYMALEIGDCIRILDIAGFEMEPVFKQYLESIGE